MGGTDKYMIVVDRGELEFGSSNMMQYYQGVTGTDPASNLKHENLRIVCTMMVFDTGLIARNASGIKSTADLKGRRAPHGFPAATLFQTMMTGFIANGGYDWKDVTQVPVSDLAKHFEALKLGHTDMAIAALGSAPVIELNAQIDGGVRYIEFATSGPGAQRMLELMPKTYYVKVPQSSGLPGIVGDTNMMAFDYVLWANKGVADDIVYRVARAMYDNEAELKKTSPLWRSHFSKNMAKDQGMPYHPAAEKFYKEVEIWKR
jgi:TRAP transporter TAXI family solute receptor